MRLALIIAPSDSRSGDTAVRREVLAWLRGRFAQFGFHVVIVGGRGDPQGEVEQAAERVSAGDTVLVHVSGRLAGRDAIAFGEGSFLSLWGMTSALAARSPSHVSLVLELMHEEDPTDALLAAEILAAAVQSTGAKARGYPVLAAVRSLAMAVDRVAFTQLALPAVNEHEGPPPTEALVEGMYDAASANPESHTTAQSFTFSRGTPSASPNVERELANGEVERELANGEVERELANGEVERELANGEVERELANREVEPELANAEAEGALAYGEVERVLASGGVPQVPAGKEVRRGITNGDVQSEVVSGEIRKDDEAYGAGSLARPRHPVASGTMEVGQYRPPSDVPSSGASLHSLIAEATEQRDWRRALQLRRQRLHMLASPRQKARELVAMARILQAELGDAEGALETLEMARALEPRPVNILLALRRGYQQLGRWPQAIEVIGALTAFTESPAQKAEMYVASARIALKRLGDRERAIEWLRAAQGIDPTNAEAAAVLEQVSPPREVRSTPAASAQTEPFVDATPRGQPVPVRAAAPVQTVQPIAPAAPPEPDLPSLQKDAERLLGDGADDEALGKLEAIAARAPTGAFAYEKAFAVHWRAGRTDAAFLAALALEELDAADVDQQVLIEQFRSVGPIRVRASLDEAGWKALSAPGSDNVLTALFAAVEEAAIATRLEELREARRLPPLDPAERLSESSTASIVRSFQWAARVLSIPCPNLYLRDEVAGGISAIPAREPSTALGPSVVSGPSAKDLAFLAGRHLTYYRPGHQVLLYYPNREDLTALLLSAAQLAMPHAAAGSDDMSVRGLRARLARHLKQEDRFSLERAVRDLDARGGQASLGTWISSIELMAGRAGLLLCGDLATATAIVRSETRNVANVTAEGRREDLVSFCASRTHAVMRTRVAATAPESIRPPPPPSSNSLQIAP